MRTYSCRLRVSSIVSTLASAGGEETEEGTRGHLEIERIQNTAASANDASDALAVWIDVVSLWVRMGFYIMIWGDLGFNYSFFDGLVMLSIRACVYDAGKVMREWRKAEIVRRELDETFEGVEGDQLEEVRTKG
jgi:hypothetical protein